MTYVTIDRLSRLADRFVRAADFPVIQSTNYKVIRPAMHPRSSIMLNWYPTMVREVMKVK